MKRASPKDSLVLARPVGAGPIRRLTRDELPIDTVELARYLIGRVVVHDLPEGRTSGRIVETEAYPVGDAACHAFRGIRTANRSLWLERGRAYVYFIYGSCYCLNVTSEATGIGAGVLLRAIEPLEGLDLMQERRRVIRPVDLGRGPGRLAAALGIDRRQDGFDLFAGGPLWLGLNATPVGAIATSGRIGLSRESDRLLRYYESGNRYVSGPRRLLCGLPDRLENALAGA